MPRGKCCCKLGGVMVERYNLSQQPQAFVANEKVRALLAGGGVVLRRGRVLLMKDILAKAPRLQESGK